MIEHKALKNLLSLAVIAAVSPILSVSAADSGSWSLGNSQSQQSQQSQQAWLGVSITHVPEVMSKQLGGIIPAGQGLIIQTVSPQSPAASAGLQAFDIILAMGDQKIYSAEQFSGLVRAAQPESEVKLQVVRQGKLQELPVKLGKHDAPSSVEPSWGQQGHPMMRAPMRRMMPPMTPPPVGNKPSTDLAWDSFESVQVKTLGDGRYRAEISYKDEKGEKKSFFFEGKRDELESLINKQKGLPQGKKQALLNALNMNPEAMFSPPQWGANFFNDPFFRDGWGQNSFFQQGFPRMPDFNHFFQNSSLAPNPQHHGGYL